MASGSGVNYQLWMGNLEPYMTENFILTAFQKMGENPQTVRVMRNKNRPPSAYCFINFLTEEEAIQALHKLNGKPIPETNPILHFRLSRASNSCGNSNEQEFSIWVGNLPLDLDNYTLYKVFSERYSSIKTAEIMYNYNSSGSSKGHAFVRFGNQNEQKAALVEMDRFIGLGTLPLNVRPASEKKNKNDSSEPRYDIRYFHDGDSVQEVHIPRNLNLR